MPPFGPQWFRSIEEGSSLGRLRESWIYRMMEQDSREEAQRDQDNADLQGFYANPELFFKLRDARNNVVKTEENEPFSVKTISPEFTARLNAARDGKVIIKPQNEYVAERVRMVRAEREAAKRQDPRMAQQEPGSTPLDTIDVEYRLPTKHG